MGVSQRRPARSRARWLQRVADAQTERDRLAVNISATTSMAFYWAARDPARWNAMCREAADALADVLDRYWAPAKPAKFTLHTSGENSRPSAGPSRSRAHARVRARV